MADGPEKVLTCEETIVYLRHDLEETFPGVEFKVTCSGVSVNVEWTWGPSYSEVDQVTERYEGSSGEGPFDFRIGRHHWLMPDGTIRFNALETNPYKKHLPVEWESPHPDAIKLVFGVDFYWTKRNP